VPALLFDVNGVFERVNKQRLLRHMLEVGIAGSIVRKVNSSLSGRRKTRKIHESSRETQEQFTDFY
jgi:hypothetical protein